MGGVLTVADVSADALQALLGRFQLTLAKISDDIGRRHSFNTAVAAAMELLNAINKHHDASDAGRAVEHEALKAVVLMLSPIVPHICTALWQSMGYTEPLIDQQWPGFDKSALEQDTVELVVQVNGKLRGRISVAADADKNAIIEQALADENVHRFVGSNEVRKVIVVPGRLVNIVV